MSARSGQEGEHPGTRVLALFAGNDLPWSRRFQIRRHVARCAACEAQVTAVRSACDELRREAGSETLTSFEAIADWSRLEREMVGNIAVGVSAARCIDHVHKGRRHLVTVGVLTGLAVVFVLGWSTHIPPEQSRHIWNSMRGWAGGEAQQVSGTVLRSLPNGVAVRSQGTTLTILHPHAAMISTSGHGTMEARFVDEETGQVTITSVYGQ